MKMAREPCPEEAEAVAGPEPSPRKQFTPEEIERIRKESAAAQAEAERKKRQRDTDWHRSGDPGCTERQFQRMVL